MANKALRQLIKVLRGTPRDSQQVAIFFKVDTIYRTTHGPVYLPPNDAVFADKLVEDGLLKKYVDVDFPHLQYYEPLR